MRTLRPKCYKLHQAAWITNLLKSKILKKSWPKSRKDCLLLTRKFKRLPKKCSDWWTNASKTLIMTSKSRNKSRQNNNFSKNLTSYSSYLMSIFGASKTNTIILNSQLKTTSKANLMETQKPSKSNRFIGGRMVFTLIH